MILQLWLCFIYVTYLLVEKHSLIISWYCCMFVLNMKRVSTGQDLAFLRGCVRRNIFVSFLHYFEANSKLPSMFGISGNFRLQVSCAFVPIWVWLINIFNTFGWTSPCFSAVGGSWRPAPVSTGVLASRCCCCCGFSSLSVLSRKNSSRWSHICLCGIVGRVCCLTTGLFPLELMRPSDFPWSRPYT